MMSDFTSARLGYKPIELPQSSFSQSSFSQPSLSQSLDLLQSMARRGEAPGEAQISGASQAALPAKETVSPRPFEVTMQSTNSDKGLPEETTLSGGYIGGDFPQSGVPSKKGLEQAFSEDEKKELLSAYMDGEVSAQEQRLVRQWLASDDPLREYYQQQLKIKAALQSLPTSFFPADVLEPEVSSAPVLNKTRGDSTSSEPSNDPESNSIENVLTGTDSTQLPPSNGVLFQQATSAAATAIAPYKLSNDSIFVCRATLLDNDLRKGLMFVAALGATTVTILASGLNDRLRPSNLGRFKEFSSQAVQGQTL